MSNLKTTLILAESEFSLKELNDLIKKFPKAEIITFDYNSHTFLTKNSILHKTSDSFLSEEDLHNIQNNSYMISKWYQHTILSKILDYEGVNLGSLFYVEFQYMLVPFLKKFVEILTIYNKYPHANFFATKPLLAIIKDFTKSSKLFGNVVPSNQFLYDSIKYNVRVGKTQIPITLSRRQYQTLKKISEKIISRFVGKRHGFKNKSVLFLEFDTIRYKKLFSLIHNTSLNVFLYDRRRPSIWNTESFSIIRNSNCILINQNEIIDDQVKKSIKKGSSIINKKIDLLLKEQKILTDIFSIQGFSFWKFLKDPFLVLCKKRMLEALAEIETAKKLLSMYKIDIVFHWTENGFNEQIIINLAKKLRIPVILIQHGFYYDTIDSKKMNEFCGVLPLKSDKIIVWGNHMKQYLEKIGIEPKKIEVVGSPIHDLFFERKSKSLLKNQSTILLTTQSPEKNVVYNLTNKTLSNYEKTIETICKSVSNLNRKLVIKLHPFQEELDVTRIAKKIDKKIEIIKQGDILPLIESCDLMITFNISTTILEAQILEKPVISIMLEDYRLGTPEIFTTNSCINTDHENLEKTLERILSSNDFKREIIQKGNSFVKNYFSNQGSASEKTLKFLENVNDGKMIDSMPFH